MHNLQRREKNACKALQSICLRCTLGLYFLVPMLFELGLGKLSGGCARLASDEPET